MPLLYILSFEKTTNKELFELRQALQLEMVALVVNTTKRGITYESNFRGDQKVKEQIKEFGVAMRAYNAPNATTIWADPDGSACPGAGQR
mgnify:CR=1 FL=1